MRDLTLNTQMINRLLALNLLTLLRALTYFTSLLLPRSFNGIALGVGAAVSLRIAVCNSYITLTNIRRVA